MEMMVDRLWLMLEKQVLKSHLLFGLNPLMNCRLEAGKMSYQLNFVLVQLYSPEKIGITIPVRFHSGSRAIDVDAKLDTGATYCIFERLIGEDLGLEIEKGKLQPIGAATGSFLTFGHFITFSVEDFHFESMVYFAKDYAFNRNVLGRTGFLNRVVIGLNDYAGKLYLSREIDSE
jgi:hypothetical protein